MKRIAIPGTQTTLEDHFGGAATFVLFDVDEATGEVTGEQVVPAPPHAPGTRPAWLAEMDVHVVLAGRMGERARALLEQAGIEAVAGVQVATPAEAVRAYLSETLVADGGACHEHHEGCGEHH